MGDVRWVMRDANSEIPRHASRFYSVFTSLIILNSFPIVTLIM